jgi:hypothetical protein
MIEPIEGEIWKDIEGYEGLYQVSNMGRVKTLPRSTSAARWNVGSEGMILKGGKDVWGYTHVQFYKRGHKRTIFKVHRLVAMYFIPNPDNLPEVNHKFGNKLDNRASELEWITPKGNVNHAFATGLIVRHKGPLNPMYGRPNLAARGRKPTWEIKRGKDHHLYGKGGAMHAASIIVLNTESGVFYDCIKEAARAHGIDSSSLAKKLKGKLRNRTSLIIA